MIQLIILLYQSISSERWNLNVQHRLELLELPAYLTENKNFEKQYSYIWQRRIVAGGKYKVGLKKMSHSSYSRFMCQRLFR